MASLVIRDNGQGFEPKNPVTNGTASAFASSRRTGSRDGERRLRQLHNDLDHRFRDGRDCKLKLGLSLE
jgi:hypothetical protein